MAGIIYILQDYGPSFLRALGVTVQMTIFSLILATIIGVVVGLINVSTFRPLKVITRIYIDIIRGTPLLVQVFIMFFGITQVLNFRWPTIWGYAPAFVAGTVTLALNAGAYMAEIVRGGIEGIDKGQMEAARSLGLPYSKTMAKIILPQAFRMMLPTVINQFIISLKDTSLISVIGPVELTQNGRIIAAASSHMVMSVWLTVAIFYLVVCTLLSFTAKYVERRISYGK